MVEFIAGGSYFDTKTRSMRAVNRFYNALGYFDNSIGSRFILYYNYSSTES